MDFISPVGWSVVLIILSRQPHKIVRETVATYNDVIVRATGCSWSVHQVTYRMVHEPLLSRAINLVSRWCPRSVQSKEHSLEFRVTIIEAITDASQLTRDDF